MTAREPSAVEVIAEAMRKHHIDLDYRGPDNDTRCVCLGWVDGDDWDDHLAEAVLAAIRAMSPSEQAELIGGEVRRLTTVKPHSDKHPFCIPRTCPHREYDQPHEHVLGPWREVQP